MRFLSLCLLSLGALAIGQDSENRTLQDLQEMEGFKKMLPRGKIAAIKEGQFVDADQAAMPDDAWIIGVTDGKEAKAYSINLLNKHEIVNDFIGDKPIATTW